MSDLHEMATFEAEEGEFQEDEVWSVIEHNSKGRSKSEKGFSSSSSNAWGLKATPRTTAVAPPRLSSAPVEIPDWSNILQEQQNPRGDAYDGHGMVKYNCYNNHQDDDDMDDGEMLPPHEYLAKKRFARTQIASFSMCEEGVGRNLKGRDLSRLRNIILTKTGFLS